MGLISKALELARNAATDTVKDIKVMVEYPLYPNVYDADGNLRDAETENISYDDLLENKGTKYFPR